MEELNPVQQNAVNANDGASLIVAGAGSGKTRVLTYKIAYLIRDLGKLPNRIMALTFTNKAAKEMKERIANLIGYEEANKIRMGTFHSVFARILKYEAFALGMSSQFSIYDETDSRNLLKDIIKEMNLDNDNYKVGTVHAKISMAKNKLINPNMYIADKQIFEENTKAKLQRLGDIYEEYQKRLLKANAMDFDDLLFNTYKMFNDHPAIREHYEQEYDYVLVDEFQDTNIAQMQILLQLCWHKQNLYAVGDDAQSIYGFRGANINNILYFKTYFPHASVFKLEQNYRSTQNIVAAANSLIHHNVGQIPKNVFSKAQEGNKVVFNNLATDREEANYVINEIKRLKIQNKCNFSDFTVLYRNNAQSRCIEEALLKADMPYQIHGGISFFQRKEVKDVMAYFRLVCNCYDDEAFKRIINYPARGIGSSTIEKIKAKAIINNLPMYQIACNPDGYGIDIKKNTVIKLKNFCNMIDNYIVMSSQMNALQLGEKIMNEIGIYEYLNSGKDEDISKINNLDEIISSLDSFITMRKNENREDEALLINYLQDVALLADQVEENEEDKINLMTIHASKGLEFQTVFIVALEEGIFPSNRTSSSLQELEEERRLLYVAITRAEKNCYLTCAKQRWQYGELQKNKPSQFIQEIDDKYIEDLTDYRSNDDYSTIARMFV